MAAFQSTENSGNFVMGMSLAWNFPEKFSRKSKPFIQLKFLDLPGENNIE